MAVNPGKGPNEDNLKAILERTGYTLDVTTGQRKYGGPPPNWEGPPPGPGCEVSCHHAEPHFRVQVWEVYDDS